jgi:hypothetical protein
MIDYTDKLADEAAELVTQLTAEMADYLRKHTRSNGLMLSGELIDSIEQSVTATAGELAIQAVIQFNTYGRFKDMKVLTYSTIPPVDAMKRFVRVHKKLSISNFINYTFKPGLCVEYAHYIEFVVFINIATDDQKRIGWFIDDL